MNMKKRLLHFVYKYTILALTQWSVERFAWGGCGAPQFFLPTYNIFNFRGGRGGVTSINKNDGEGGGGLDARFAYLWRGAKHQQRNPPPATTNSI